MRMCVVRACVRECAYSMCVFVRVLILCVLPVFVCDSNKCLCAVCVRARVSVCLRGNVYAVGCRASKRNSAHCIAHWEHEVAWGTRQGA